jgi:hypothetical protein
LPARCRGAQEKRGVEGETSRFRRRWFVPVPRTAWLAEMNARLAEADAAKNACHIDGLAAAVRPDFAAERDLLLPAGPYDIAAVLWPRVDRHTRIGRILVVLR